MDTPTIAQYYRETDPAKRKELLEQAIAEEGATEENQARREIWDARYFRRNWIRCTFMNLQRKVNCTENSFIGSANTL